NVNGTGLRFRDIEPIRGRMTYSLLSGHAPGDDETAIGPSTARQLNVHAGDVVRVAGVHPLALRVSGIALLPQSPHSSFDQGLWVTPRAMTTLFGGPSEDVEEDYVVTRRPGVTDQAWERAITSVSNDSSLAIVPQDVIFL